MTANNANNNRIARNTLFLYARMILILIVGLYTSRVVLKVLGASDYGVANVVSGFVSLFSFLNATFSSTLQRFYNYEGGKHGEEGYSDVYSVGFRVHMALAFFVLLLVESIGIWYINNVMVLPSGRLQAAHILFHFSVLSMVFLIIQAPFAGAIIAMEKMDFFALVSIVDAVLRLVLVLLLPQIPFDKLIVYGVIQLCISITALILYISYSKRRFGFLKLKKDYKKTLLKELLNFSGWTLLGSFAFLMKGQGVNMILNYYFGTVVNAARGLAHNVNAALTGFSTNVSMAFRPQLVGSYAEGDTKRTFSLLLTQSKVCYALMLMFSVPVIIEINLLLSLWLGGEVPNNTNVFTILVLVDSMICTLNTPVTQVVYATGKVRAYQIGSALINILLLPVCWLFLKVGYPAYVVFVLTILFSIICQIVCLIIMHRLFNYSYLEYINKIILPCLTLSVVVPLFSYSITFFIPDSFGRLLLVSLASLMATSFMLYRFFLSKPEKALVRQYWFKILRKQQT